MSKYKLLVGDEQFLEVLKHSLQFDKYFKYYCLEDMLKRGNSDIKIDIILVDHKVIYDNRTIDFIKKNNIIHSKTKFACQAFPEGALSEYHFNKLLEMYGEFGIDESNFYFVSQWPFNGFPKTNVYYDLRLAFLIPTLFSGHGDIRELYYRRKFSENKKNKYFITRNARLRTHRTFLFLNIVKDNLLDKGYVSFLARDYTSESGEYVEFINYDDMKSNFNDPKLHEIFKGTMDVNEIRDLYKKIQPTIPLKFGDLPCLICNRDKIITGPDTVHYQHPGIEELDAYFDVVTESQIGYFPRWTNKIGDTNGNISEKSIKPFFGFNIPLYFAPPFTVKSFSKIGFEDFSNVIDISYDSEGDHIKRLWMIYNQFKKICDMDKNDVHDLYMSQKDKLIYNYELATDILRDKDNPIDNIVEFLLS